MAYAKKKTKKVRAKDTRRELQQPDEFMSVTDRVINAIVSQWKPILIVIGITAVVFVTITIAEKLTGNREDAAAGLLYDAELELPQAAGFDPYTGMAIAPDEDQAEEYRAAAAEFDAVVEQYGGTVQGDIAHLEAGNALYQAGDYEQAEQRYAAAAGSKSRMVRVLALNAQAKALESLEQYDREVEVLRTLVAEAEGATMEYAYLDLIRAHELADDGAGALTVCREFEEKLPDSPLLDDVQNKIRAMGEEPADIQPSEEEQGGGETT